MTRLLLLGIPVAISLVMIYFPVINPGLIPVFAEHCGEYCEHNTDCAIIVQNQQLIRVPAQPVNTWSNISFLILGLWVYRRRRSITAVWFALSCVVLGAGSGAFHSFMSRGGHLADLIGMFLVFNFLAVYNMFVTHRFKKFFYAVAISAVMSLVTALYVADLSSTAVLGATGITVVVHLVFAVINKRITWQQAAMAIAPFLLAFAFRQMDVAGIFCFPNSIYQGHGVWHVLAAVGIYQVFHLLEGMHLKLVQESVL
jgi:hypothetical protein